MKKCGYERIVLFWTKVFIGRWGLVGLTLAVLLLLEVFRPYFFLTDDSFSLIFPIWREVGRDLLTGKDPFASDFIFGGNYPLMHDSVFNVLWHPVPLLLSLLANTPWVNGMVDIYCIFNLLLAAVGFYVLTGRLPNQDASALSEGQRGFISLSYAFGMYSLLLGSSGFWYLVNLAALPWMLVGVFEARKVRSVLISAAALYHSFVGGYPSCFFYSGIFLSVIVLWYAWRQRSIFPLVRWCGAGLLAVICAVPSVWPSFVALKDSVRGGAIDPLTASEHSMPLLVQIVSFFFGSCSYLAGEFILFGCKAHAYALVSCAAAPLFVAAFFRRRGQGRDWDFLILSLLGLAALLVARPLFLGEIISKVPILQSFRWPHKEVFLILFFAHLWMARGLAGSLRMIRILQVMGVVVFLLPLVLYGPPSLGAHTTSRRLYFSGEAAAYWKRIQEVSDPEKYMAPILPISLLEDIPAYQQIPGIVIGSHNFPALFGVKSWSGYSATLSEELFRRVPRAYNVYGVFTSDSKEALLKKGNVKSIEILKAHENASDEFDEIGVSEITETGECKSNRIKWPQ